MSELLTASDQRVEPLCYHYRVDRCGGCQLQHLRYDAQLEAKRGIVRDSIVRIGKRDVDAPEVEPSPKQWRYRLKLTLALRHVDGDWIVGLRPYDDPDAVFQLSDCPITDERVVNIWREVMEARAYFPPADELRASVRLLDDGAAIVMEGGQRLAGALGRSSPTSSRRRRSGGGRCIARACSSPSGTPTSGAARAPWRARRSRRSIRTSRASCTPTSSSACGGFAPRR